MWFFYFLDDRVLVGSHSLCVTCLLLNYTHTLLSPQIESDNKIPYCVGRSTPSGPRTPEEPWGRAETVAKCFRKVESLFGETRVFTEDILTVFSIKSQPLRLSCLFVMDFITLSVHFPLLPVELSDEFPHLVLHLSSVCVELLCNLVPSVVLLYSVEGKINVHNIGVNLQCCSSNKKKTHLVWSNWINLII